MTLVVRVVNRVQFGSFNVGVCVLKLAFITKQQRQGVMNPDQFTSPAERGRDSEGHLEKVNGFLFLSLAITYLAKNAVRLVAAIMFSALREETGRL